MSTLGLALRANSANTLRFSSRNFTHGNHNTEGATLGNICILSPVHILCNSSTVILPESSVSMSLKTETNSALVSSGLPSPGFFYGSSRFPGLRPRLAVARRVLSLWCALPLSSRARFSGPLTLFMLLPFEAELSVSTIALKDSASFWTELVPLPPSLTSSTKSDVISLSFSWSTSGGG